MFALLMCLCYFRTVLTEPGRVHPHNRDELILMPFKKEVEADQKEIVREAREQTAIAMSPVAAGGEQLPQQRIDMRTVMSAGCSGQD